MTVLSIGSGAKATAGAQSEPLRGAGVPPRSWCEFPDGRPGVEATACKGSEIRCGLGEERHRGASAGLIRGFFAPRHTHYTSLGGYLIFLPVAPARGRV